MKKIILLVLIIFAIGCNPVKNLDKKLERNYPIEFSVYDTGELRANYANNSSRWREHIKGNIDNTLNLVGTPNEFGWKWETPEIFVNMDSRVIVIRYK